MFSTLVWAGNERVDAQTSHGVAMSVFAGRLMMVYVGSGGHNLWVAELDSLSEPLKLKSNVQIVIAGLNAPKSQYRPALATDGKLLHCVYAGDDNAAVYWSWFDGQTWKGNIPLPPTGLSHDPQYQPSLTYFDGMLHCFVNRSDEFLHCAYDTTKPQVTSSWTAWTLIKGSYSGPSSAVINGRLILAATDSTSCLRVGEVKLNLPGALPTGWSPQAIGSGVDESHYSTLSSNPGIVMVPWGDSDGALMCYLPSDNEIYYLYFELAGLSSAPSGIFPCVPYHGNTQIKCANSTPGTSDTLGLAYFADAFVIAYRGESSDNFYLAYGKPSSAFAAPPTRRP